MDFYFSFGKKKPSEKETIFTAAIIWGFIEAIIDPLLDYLNRKIISRFDGEKVKVIFDELDIFWLRNGNRKHYSDSDIRLIIALFVRSVEDNNLSRKELLAMVDFIQRKWVASEALQKIFTQADEVVDAHVESTIDQAIDLYEKMYMERPQTPEEFVANTSEIIFHEPDESEAQGLLGGMIEIKNKFFY